MKVSELISILQEAKDRTGDIDVSMSISIEGIRYMAPTIAVGIGKFSGTQSDEEISRILIADCEIKSSSPNILNSVSLDKFINSEKNGD